MNLRDELRGIAAFCIATVGIAIGAPTQVPTTRTTKPPATPKKQLREIQINADSYWYANDLFIAEGTVEIIDGDMRLTADHVAVKMRKSTKASSDPKAKKASPYEFIKATGKTSRVILKTAQGKAVADCITYDLTKGAGMAVLTGKPEVTLIDGGRMFGANSIMMDRTNQVLWTVGGKPKAIIPNEGRGAGIIAGPKTDVKTVPKPKGKLPPVPPVKKEDVAKGPKSTPPKGPAKEAVPRPPTEVEADKLVYDMKANVIRCIGTVHVVDEELDLKAEVLEIFRNDQGVTTKIVATGKNQPVRIETVMKDFKRGIATGPKLVYDVSKQVMTLSGKANLKTERGQFVDVEQVLFTRTKTGFNVNVKRGTGTFTMWTDKSFMNLKDMNKKKPKTKKKDAPKTEST
jgi:lipopolysaccharide transport protein LptA